MIISALYITIQAMTRFSTIAQSFLDYAFTNLKGDTTGVALMMAEKGASVTQRAITHVVSGLVTHRECGGPGGGHSSAQAVHLGQSEKAQP